ncbi:hypothetical protein [Photorhabdus aegyptia]|uniref:hypothetical protein n=1 Tax=Photorhabdus aegyptia TaxID=2805098 RepID=UPI001E653394|nr:hypothetical protein [Photorhabdus aegyptia]MCC8458161.1 hypothetical protein [Photorhabdus aegyptia]
MVAISGYLTRYFYLMGNAIKVGNIDTAFGDCKTTLGLWIWLILKLNNIPLITGLPGM